MKVPSLQKIDRLVGVPLCFFLTLIRKVFTGALPPGPAKVRNILFVKPAEQGSSVLAIAAIQKAVAMVGRENVYFIVFEENRFILDLFELIPESNIITVKSSSIAGLASTTYRAMRKLWSLKLDAAIDMEFFARGSAAMAFLSGAKVRVGFHSIYAAGPYRGDLMTHRLLYNPHLHTTAMFQVLVDVLKCDPEKLPTLDFYPGPSTNDFHPFTPRDGEVATVKQLLPEINGKLPPVILLNPNASDLLPLRQWPNRRYVDLAIRMLAKYPEIHIGFTGGPREAEEIERLVREVNSPRCFCTAGKTTLRQLMVLYTLAEVLVTNDSGPAHFASMTQINVITLFGPETPKLFAAQTPRNLPIWAGIACSPCVNAYNNRQTKCTNNICMQEISVDQVFSALSKVYEDRKAVK